MINPKRDTLDSLAISEILKEAIYKLKMKSPLDEHLSYLEEIY